MLTEISSNLLSHNEVELDCSTSSCLSPENGMNEGSDCHVASHEASINLLPSFIRHGRANVVPGVISELKELLTKGFDDALSPIEEILKNANFFWINSNYSNERRTRLKKISLAFKTIQDMKRDRTVTLNVIDDIQSQKSSFPLRDSRGFTSDDALLLDVHLKGGPRYYNYIALQKVLNKEFREDLFNILDTVIRSVKMLLSQWLGLDFSSVEKFKKAPCACCNAEYEDKLVSRTKFKDCGNNCQVSFYCLNKLGKVYIDPTSKDICEACRDILSKNLANRKR